MQKTFIYRHANELDNRSKPILYRTRKGKQRERERERERENSEFNIILSRKIVRVNIDERQK